MEFTWNDAIIRAQQITGNSRPRRSERNGLAMVFEWAQRKGIALACAEHACMAQISNLQSAVGELKRAMRWNDTVAFANILHLCATKPNAELRLALHTVYLQEVPVEMSADEVTVKLTPAQFATLQGVMKLRHKYVEQTPLELGYDIYQ